MTSPDPITGSTKEASRAARRGRYVVSLKMGVLLAVGSLVVGGVLFYSSFLDWYQVRRLNSLLDRVQLVEAREYAASIAQESRNADVLLNAIRALRITGDYLAADELLRQSAKVISDPERIRTENLLNDACRGILHSPSTEIPRLLTDPALDSRDVCESYIVGFRINRSFDQAMLLINAWRKDWPTDPRPWFHEGLINQSATHWDVAVRSYKEALERKRDFIAVERRLGQCLAQLERHDEAIAHFDSASRNDPTDMEAWIGLGESLEATGQPDDARRAFVEALKVDAGNFQARISIAEIDFRNDRVSHAETIVEDLIALWPEDVRTLYLQAQIANSKGQTEQANEILERWKIADKAVEVFESQVPLLAKQPDRVDLQVQIGEGLMKHYSRRMGRQYLLAALQMSPTNSRIIDLLQIDDTRRAKLRALPVPEALPTSPQG